MIESVDNEGKGKKSADSSTPVLDNFSKDLIKLAEQGKIDPVIGREREINRIAQILSRRKKNNPVIVGEAGVGKCICSDTEVVIRNDKTGEIFKLKVSDFINNITNP